MRRLGEFSELDDASPLQQFQCNMPEQGFISTPSYHQVVQPNKNAAGRWRRCQAHFGEAVHLQPMLDYWGYDLSPRFPQSDLRRSIRFWYGQAPRCPSCAAPDVGVVSTRLSRFHTRNGRGIRPGLDGSGPVSDELDITPLSDEGFQRFFYHQIGPTARWATPRSAWASPPPTLLLAKLRIKRYAAGVNEGFQPHF